MEKITEKDILDISEQLRDNKTVTRRNAAKKIIKYNLISLGDELFEAYKKEQLDKRTWETQMVMIKAFGKIHYIPIIPVLDNILAERKNYDSITDEVALAYVRLKRKNVNDAQPILDLLKYKIFSIVSGSLSTLAFDDMQPSTDQINAIILKINSFNEEILYEEGCGDVREYILSAASKWDKKTNSILRSFIDKCLQIDHIKINVDVDKIAKSKKFIFE